MSTDLVCSPTDGNPPAGVAAGARRGRDASIGTPPKLTADELRLAYRVAASSRAMESMIIRLASRGEVKFATWGTGEEIHAVASALALAKALGRGKLAIAPHYRSGCLMTMWSELNGVGDFQRQVLRQQFSRATDEHTGGRQMVYHLAIPELGILPVQSPVGMQLGKAAGWAMGNKLRGVSDAVAVAIIGDGTSAESDLHEAMNAASVWSLPLIVMITDNAVAISTRPEEGRGIVDFDAYARAFGMRHLACDGRYFDDVFSTTYRAACHARDRQTGVVLHIRNLPRLNGHSSAADMTFDLDQDDPLIDFGKQLVDRGLLEPADVVSRREGTVGRDYFAHHELGSVMQAEATRVQALIDETLAEPTPAPESVGTHVYRPFPPVEETPADGQTCISYAAAIRAALDTIIRERGGALWGQDVARLGGVMTATAGLKARHPRRVIDAPLNEPLIVGTACGAGLHDDVIALPEIQFGDYSLNAMHWLVYLGNMHWSTHGNVSSAVILRMPTDPFGGGALYHSMSVDGYFTPIPGLVIVMPSTSLDVYGLLMTAADYRGPVVVLEPKWMYRQALGPAFPGEPSEPSERAALKKRLMRADVPSLPANVRVPFSKAAVRRVGDDVTIVAWGRAVWTAMTAAETLAADGIEADVLDLRTLVPPDLDAVFGSVRRTGCLVVAAEDRPFAGFGRSIQGAVVEAMPGVPTAVLGQRNLPGIPQSPVLEKAVVLDESEIATAARAVATRRASGAPAWSWVPRRFERC
jgi:2-oxoisovalerate dehydrogenase E1 component